MRTTVALGAALALAVSLAAGWYLPAALLLLGYVVWTYVRTVIEHRARWRRSP